MQAMVDYRLVCASNENVGKGGEDTCRSETATLVGI